MSLLVTRGTAILLQGVIKVKAQENAQTTLHTIHTLLINLLRRSTNWSLKLTKFHFLLVACLKLWRCAACKSLTIKHILMYSFNDHLKSASVNARHPGIGILPMLSLVCSKWLELVQMVWTAETITVLKIVQIFINQIYISSYYSKERTSYPFLDVRSPWKLSVGCQSLDLQTEGSNITPTFGSWLQWSFACLLWFVKE